MELSTSALHAAQIALDVTSNNVANQNTVGYTREIMNWQAADVVTLVGASSSGVTSERGAISQRDRVLEQRVQQQTQAQAQSAVVESGLQQVQNIFGFGPTGTSSGTTALGSAKDMFFSSLSALTSSPSDISTRQSVLSNATILVSAFNTASSQLSQLATSLDQQVVSTVEQVNSLTSIIAVLNGEISSVSAGKDGGTLEDERQAAIAQLSQYVGLDQVRTERNGITLTTNNGTVLVGGTVSYGLSTVQIAGATHVVAGSGPQDLTSSLSGGQLGGVLSVRDKEIPKILDALDTLAYGIATQVNLQNTLGVDGNGNPGLALFSGVGGILGSAGSISVSATSPSAIAAASSGQGTMGNGNAQALSDLSKANIAGGTTASGFYASLLSQIGSDAASATANNTVQQTTLTQFTTQRDSLSGVSLDQEAANLTRYQRSYEAAAKVFAIANSIMASALNLGEQTTVS